MEEKVIIRKAHIEDAEEIMRMIQEFANYVGKQEQVSMNVAQLTKTIFNEEKANVLLAEVSGHKIGYALYYPIFSSFSGKVSLYLEDLYISPLFQHKGFGREMLNVIREIATSDMDGMVQWKCLKWNTKAKAFYEKLGADFVDDSLTFKLML